MDPLAVLLRAFAETHPDTVSDELIELAERFDAGTVTVNESDTDAPTAIVWPDGVDPMTDDELAALRDGLTELADVDDLSSLVINAAADMVVEIDTEVDTRVTLAEAEAAEDQAARDRLRNGGVDPEASDTDPSEPAEDETDGDGADGDEGTEGGDGEEAEAAAEPEPAMASATPAQRRASLAALATRSAGSRRNASPPTSEATAPLRISFAAGHQPVLERNARAAVTDIDRAITEAAARFSGSGAIIGREDVRVASILYDFPEERTLVDGSGRFVGSDIASDRVNAVLAQGELAANTRVAAGGFCAPPQPIYTVNTMGQTGRPIRDTALTSFRAGRGRVVQLVPPRLQALAGSAGIWTEAMDIDAVDDPDVVKNILRVVCGPEESSQTQAVTSRLRYGTTLARTYSEWLGAWTGLARVAHAQLAEQTLFAALVAKAQPVSTENTQLSATRDFVNYVARLAWHVRKRNRELRTFPFRLVTSADVLDIVAEDFAVSAMGDNPEDNLTRAEQWLTAALAARNINVTWSPDIDIPGAQGNTEAANYPTTVPYVLYPEGWALFLDEGQEDLGVVRDAQLIAQNDVETFMETFEGVHRVGTQSDARTGRITLCPSGAVYGFADPDGRCASYT